jgi:hypothetical protein
VGKNLGFLIHKRSALEIIVIVKLDEQFLRSRDWSIHSIEEAGLDGS